MEVKIKAKNVEELNQWLDSVCTRCAMSNRDCGHCCPCDSCMANQVYEWLSWLFKTHGKEGN